MSCWLDILHNKPMGLHKIGLNSSFPSSRIIKHLVPGNHIWERPDKWHWNPIGCCRLGVEEECCLFDRFECGWRQSTHASHIPAPFLEPIISPPPLLIAQIAYSTQACVCVCRLKMGRIEKCYNEQNKSENIPVSSLHSFLPTTYSSLYRCFVSQRSEIHIRSSLMRRAHHWDLYRNVGWPSLSVRRVSTHL